MSYGDEKQYEPLIGRTVVFVRETTLYLDDGKAYAFDLEGDCCSHSYYTPDGEAAFAELLGAQIRKIENREEGDHAERMISKWGVDEEDQWAFLVFTTDRGHVTADWRNASNGYYGGWVELREVRGLCAPLLDAALECQHAWVAANFEALQKATEPPPVPPAPRPTTGAPDFTAMNGLLKQLYRDIS